MSEEGPKGEMVLSREMNLVAPASAEKIVEVFKAFEWMKQNIITLDDRQKIGGTSFIKKSGWMKIALACDVSLEKRDERVEKLGDDTIFHYTYRAIAPSGRFADADASASTSERKFTHFPHDCRALAQTRACNRAVANLVGGGEVSFEEVEGSSIEPSTSKESNGLVSQVGNSEDNTKAEPELKRVSISYTIEGPDAVFRIPFKQKDRFKETIHTATGTYPRWDNVAKTWSVNVDLVNFVLAEELEKAGFDLEVL